MRSKNKPRQTPDESEFCSLIASFPCVCCGAPGPCEVHEFEQGLWFASVPLCWLCHQGPDGWHGTRLRWTLRKMTMAKAINETLRRVFAELRRMARGASWLREGRGRQSGDS